MPVVFWSFYFIIVIILFGNLLTALVIETYMLTQDEWNANEEAKHAQKRVVMIGGKAYKVKAGTGSANREDIVVEKMLDMQRLRNVQSAQRQQLRLKVESEKTHHPVPSRAGRSGSATTQNASWGSSMSKGGVSNGSTRSRGDSSQQGSGPSVGNGASSRIVPCAAAAAPGAPTGAGTPRRSSPGTSTTPRFVRPRTKAAARRAPSLLSDSRYDKVL